MVHEERMKSSHLVRLVLCGT